MEPTEQNNQTEANTPTPKEVPLGFLLTPPISLFGAFAYFLLDSPSRNEGLLLQFIFKIVLFISGCISLSSFFFYDSLYSAESNFSAAFFLLIPFSGLILCSCVLTFLGLFNVATMLLAPYALIYIIMLIILIGLRE